MTTDPPRGLKANIKRTYEKIITQETYEDLSLKPQSSTQDFTETSQNSKVNMNKLSEK